MMHVYWVHPPRTITVTAKDDCRHIRALLCHYSGTVTINVRGIDPTCILRYYVVFTDLQLQCSKGACPKEPGHPNDAS